jgi:hypothetical protein
MKTRRLRVDVILDIEHRTDGFYYRLADGDMRYIGPYSIEVLSEEIADCFEEQLRWQYELFYKEAPR